MCLESVSPLTLYVIKIITVIIKIGDDKIRKIYLVLLLFVLVLFLNVSDVSAENVTVDQVSTAAGTVKSYVETNHALPSSVNISGSQVSMPQFLELSTTSVLNINSSSNATIALGNYSDALSPTENTTSQDINKTEYLDIANRVKSFMHSNARAPNYATQTSTGSTIRFESLVYMYSQILDSYNTNKVLPDHIKVDPWTTITSNVIGHADYGYVEKEFYGNQSSSQTIVLIIGVHPQENGIHTAIADALTNKSVNLTKRYVIYKVHVTEDVSDYSKGRMNGQLLAQQFIVPDVSSENPMLVVDNHENHGADSGYDYYRFLYPISNTAITTTYANEIISQTLFLVIYSPPNPTSPQYVTVPIANQGITTIIYETYMYDLADEKKSDANALIDALDRLDGEIANILTVTANPAGKDYYSPQNVVLAASEETKIYYTLDGTDPTKNSRQYTGPINIETSKTLKFTAWDTAGNQSQIYTEFYRIYKSKPYSYTVNVPYKRVWYKGWYKAPYKVKVRAGKYKVGKRWRYIYKYVTKYKKKRGWLPYWLYRNETRWDNRWVLT